VKILLSCFNIYSYSKVNPFEKLPEIFNKTHLYEILLASLFRINAYNESLVLLQFIDRFSIEDINTIVKKISYLPLFYIDLINLPIILEKLFEKFAGKDERIVFRLMERIKSGDIYNTNFDLKLSKVHNFAKIMLVRYAYTIYVENLDMNSLSF